MLKFIIIIIFGIISFLAPDYLPSHVFNINVSWLSGLIFGVLGTIIYNELSSHRRR